MGYPTREGAIAAMKEEHRKHVEAKDILMRNTVEVATSREVSPFDIIAVAFDEAHRMVHQIEALADKLVGPVPANAVSGTESPGALLHDYEHRARYLSARLQDGFDALHRINRALP
jgi:hypothetical protein